MTGAIMTGHGIRVVGMIITTTQRQGQRVGQSAMAAGFTMATMIGAVVMKADAAATANGPAAITEVVMVKALLRCQRQTPMRRNARAVAANAMKAMAAFL